MSRPLENGQFLIPFCQLTFPDGRSQRTIFLLNVQKKLILLFASPVVGL